MAKKTVRVAQVLFHANVALASEALSQDEKKGVCGLLESALHAAEVYKGFTYRGGYDPSGAREYDRRYLVAVEIIGEYMAITSAAGVGGEV